MAACRKLDAQNVLLSLHVDESNFPPLLLFENKITALNPAHFMTFVAHKQQNIYWHSSKCTEA